jgi:fatty acid desaturase
MDLYEPSPKKTEEEPQTEAKAAAAAFAAGLGLAIGVALSAALESMLIWLILTSLVGLSVTFFQVLGTMLIINGFIGKFK